MPWTALLTSCFMENFVTRRVYQRRPDGARTWSDNLGGKPILAHAVADIGGSAAGDPAPLLPIKSSWALHDLPRTSLPMHGVMRQTGAEDCRTTFALRNPFSSDLRPLDIGLVCARMCVRRSMRRVQI